MSIVMGNVRKIPLPLWVLFFNSLTMALGFFMLIPLLAVYLLDQLALAATIVGIIVGVRSFCQQGFMLFGGVISDRIGYKTIICSGVFIRAIGFILFGFAEGIPLLLVAAVLSGVGGSLFHPSSYAYYTVLSTKENRATVYATREMLSNVGFIFGPVLGAFLLNFHFQLVCLVAGIMFLLVFIVSAISLPVHHPTEKPTPFVKNINQIISNRAYVTFCFFMIFVWTLVSQLYLAVPVKLQLLQSTDVNVGYIYSTGALLIVFLQVPLINSLSGRFTPTKLIALGSIFLTVGIVTIGFTPNVVGIYLGVIMFTFGQMFIQPMMSKQISEIAPLPLIASFFGFNGLALAVGGLIGNIVGGFLYDVALQGSESLPWIVFGIAGLLVTIALLRLGKKERVKEPGTVSVQK